MLYLFATGVCLHKEQKIKVPVAELISPKKTYFIKMHSEQSEGEITCCVKENTGCGEI